MKTPIKDKKNNFKCYSVLKELIPKGTIVETYNFFAGDLELRLASEDRFVIANTEKLVVYEFWKSISEKPDIVAAIAETVFPFESEKTFNILQENWPKYKDPCLRSALFFLLNNCSDNGMISYGSLKEENYNPLVLARLKRFTAKNLHIKHLKISTVEHIKKENDSDLIFIPIGRYIPNVLSHGINRGFEETVFDHDELIPTCLDNKKSILLYLNHKRLHNIANCDKIFIDKYGRQTKDRENAKEIILHNV